MLPLKSCLIRWVATRQSSVKLAHSRERRCHMNQQIPTVAEFFVAATAGTMGAKANTLQSGDSANRDEIPNVARDNVGSDEVNIVGVISALASAAMADGDAEGIAVEAGDRFHLYASEAAAGIHDEVVGGVVAIGLGDVQAAAKCLVEKTHLGPFALMFGRMDAHDQ